MRLGARPWIGLAAWLLLACSGSGSGNVPGAASGAGASGSAQGTAGSAAESGAGAGGANATGQAGQSAAPTSGAGATAGMAGVGGSDADAGSEPDGAAGDSGMPDCTPVEWTNPGGVENPEVVSAGPDEGTLFEQKEGLAEFGYVMEEFFFTGTSPAYTSRMVVRRPSDPARFSGTVFVEWYNVSGGIDFAVLWADSREYFMREGHVFVGVSAQAVGANALADRVDAERYAPIDHPGDQAAAAIFSQAGVALRTQSETLLGPCMPVRALLAIGQSQSSFRLAQYVDDAHAAAQVYDGFLLHSGLEPASNDPDVPVFVVLTMSEGNGRLEDGPNLVKWNVAGATHNGKRVTERGAEAAGLIGLDASAVTQCVNPLNAYPSYRAYSAALDWLERWVRDGERPPAGPRFQMAGSQLAVDEHGNARGGVRTPDIDVAIATYGFDNAPANPLDFVSALACGLGGTTVPFTPDKLRQLYPTHDDYVARYKAAADQALANGYLLQADYDEAVMQAEAAAVPP